MRNANRWKVAYLLVRNEDFTFSGKPLTRLGFDPPTFRWFAHFKIAR